MSQPARAKVAAVSLSPLCRDSSRTPSLRELEEDEPQGNVRNENPLWSLFDQSTAESLDA
jgi:hypothetical protein